MSQNKGKSFPIKIAAAVAAVVVFATLFAIPFKFENSEDGFTYSPVVPWFMICEEYSYFEEPSNAPFIGEWDFPIRSVKRKLIIFGKEYRSDIYLEYKDGRVEKI